MPGESQKVRLLVLYGGRSAEHEVSCVSAFHVAQAIDPQRYDLRLIGITTAGQWVETPALSTATTKALPSPDELPSPGSSSLAEVVVASPDETPLVVLPLLHGPFGEDGTVQGLLELAGLPYCGAGVAGSAVAMDKGLAKSVLMAAGLPQAKYISLRENEIDGATLASRIDQHLGWPVFVKPANLGSSIGVTKVDGAGDLDKALDLVRRFDEYVVIEEAIPGRELEIGVLGWPDLRASVPGEVKPSHEFYDYEDKYVDGAAGLVIPAELPDGVADEMAGLAIAACRALRVDSMARVDFFFDERGRGLVVNEVNTIPGFTPISMYPRLWAASGVPYATLVDELVDQALRRAGRRRRFETHRP